MAYMWTISKISHGFPQEAVHLLYGQLVVKDMFVVGRWEGGQMHAGSLKG